MPSAQSACKLFVHRKRKGKIGKSSVGTLRSNALPVSCRDLSARDPLSVSSSSASTAAAGGDRTKAACSRSCNEHKADITEGERLLADELRALTIAERESVYHDIHGIRTQQASFPDGAGDEGFVERHLKALQHELSMIRRKDAYNRTAFRSPAVVKDRHLLVSMLRKAEWKADVAAKKFVKFFETRSLLFGEDALGESLRFKCLPTDVQLSLRAGAVIVKNHYGTDSANRRIMILNYRNFYFHSALAVLQAIWYLAETVEASDYNTPTSYVVVVNMVGATSLQHRIGIHSVHLMSRHGISDSVPMELTSNHICFQSTRVKPVISLAMLAVPKRIRLRTKLHYGTLDEILLELATYGIPRHVLFAEYTTSPGIDSVSNNRRRDCRYNKDSGDSSSTGDGQDALSEYLQDIITAENAGIAHKDEQKPPGCHHMPRPTDVVLGRGRPYQLHPGNVALSGLLKELYEEYNGAEHGMSKTALSMQYVRRVKETGVRFLKHDPSGRYWQEIPDEEARQKVMMTMRNLSRGQ